MTIITTKKEFQELRKFLSTLKNPKINKLFNDIFSKDHNSTIKGFVNPITNEIVINIPETHAVEVAKVFVKYGPDIAKIAKGGSSITNAPKWLMCIKNISTDIGNALTRKIN